MTPSEGNGGYGWPSKTNLRPTWLPRTRISGLGAKARRSRRRTISKLSNDAVEIDGTVLYADLAESTPLVKGYKDWFAAEVYKNYLYCAARIIRLRGGVITAYDGDRV